ncbi:MAG: hypothetical protein ACYC8T_03990 [Myxococcaceae bacterium]
MVEGHDDDGTAGSRPDEGGGAKLPDPVPQDPPSVDPGPVGSPDGGLVGIFPLFLKNGRTYDQERSYIEWTGPVSYVTLVHRDQTALPAEEGGTSCGGSCTERVTRIGAGGSVSGHFTFLETFNVQVASEQGAGTVVIEACGQTIMNQSLGTSSGTAGFNNFPVPSWAVPTAGDCTWKVSAVSGFVDFRAVTVSYRRSSSLPTVDVKINGSDGPVGLITPAGFTVTSTSSNGICAASGSWSGSPAATGSQDYGPMGGGTYTYKLTRSNSEGTVTDTAVAAVVEIQ